MSHGTRDLDKSDKEVQHTEVAARQAAFSAAQADSSLTNRQAGVPPSAQTRRSPSAASP
jgi:hypothetical protein